MNDIQFTIAYLAVNIFTIFIVEKTYSIFFARIVRNKYIYFASYAVVFILNSLVYLLFNIPAVTMIVTIVLFFILTFNYDAPVIKKLLCTISVYALLSLSEAAFVILYNWANVKFNLINSDLFIVWGMMCSKMLSYSILVIIRKFKFNEYLGTSIKELLQAIIVIISLFFLSFFIMVFDNSSTTLTILGLISIFILIIFLFNFLSVNSILSQEKAAHQIFKMQIEYYQNQISQENLHQEEMKKYRHDMKFHINTMKSIMEKGEYSKASNYLDTISKSLPISKNICDTGIIELDSILNYHLGLAKANNIEVELSLNIESDIHISTYEYISIIGNLLSNSIEAAVQVQPKSDRKIQLSIGSYNNGFFMEIINPYKTNLQTSKTGFISTKPNPKLHGYGLAQVRNIVDKYEGTLLINTSNNLFKVSIVIF